MIGIPTYRTPLSHYVLLALLTLMLAVAAPGAWAKKPDGGGGGGGKPAKTAVLTVTASGPGEVSFADADGNPVSCRDAPCTATYPAGKTTVSLNAIPDADAAFSGWSGDCTGTGACTVTLRADRSVGAAFEDTAPPPPPPPTPRASAAGDSITMGFAASCSRNVNFWDLFCLLGGDQPENSWFNGGSSAVLSVIDRYRLEVDPDTSATKAAAESGSEMVGVTVGGETPRNFVDQAAEIVGQVPLPNRVEVMLGGNDICNRDCADPADCSNPLLDDESWRAGVRAGLDILVNGLPEGATILLVGVPRVQDLYAAGIARQQADSGVNCQNVWSTYGICRIATNDGTLKGESHAERLAAIGERQQRYNEILAELAQTYNGTNGIEVVAEYGDGKGFSVGTYAFGAGDINGGDCFHPSVSGQNIVADVVWGNNPDNPAP